MTHFAHNRGAVFGDLFVGREKEQHRVRLRVLDPDWPNAVAIVGLPGVGKSSLAWQCTQFERERHWSNRRYPAWINVGEYDTAEDLLCQMAASVVRSMREAGVDVGDFEDSLDAVLDRSDASLPSHLKGLFADIRAAGHRPIVVLDEFDHARTICRGRSGPFQTLRELATGPSTRVGLVLVARRPIELIETTAGISYLARSLESMYLRAFSHEEIDRCVASQRSRWPVGVADVLERVVHWSGGIPLLLVNGLAEALDLATYGPATVESQLEDYMSALAIDYYDQLTEILDRELRLLHQLREVLGGSPIEHSSLERSLLERYGLLVRSGGSVRSIADGFVDYLGRR